MKQTLIMTIGLPASGKSTWAREYIKLHPEFKIVCRDDLRAMLDDGEWSTKNEETIIRIRDKIIFTLLDSGHSVIVADTNLSDKVRKRIIELVNYVSKTTNRNVEIIEKSFLDVPVDECIRRDLKRTNSVGARVIRDMALRLNIKPEIKPVVTDNPPAYIVDIDGTLAIMNGRGPFDWKKVGSDLPNTSVINVVRALSKNAFIIVVSGRDGSCEKETIEWLDEHMIPVNAFFMRKPNDMRGDDIVKKEIFDKYIKNNYNVLGVFDDRPKILRMWRELGLTVFDVAQSEEF